MALSTSRTVVTNTGLSTHDHFKVRDLISVGVATFSNFKTGSTNVHSVGVEAAGINVLGGDTPIGAGATIYDDGGVRFVGVVTATSFVGSGANLTGIDATAIQTGTTKIQTSATLISNQISGSGIATVQAGGLDVTGIITATSFSGSGANLTSLPAANITGTLPAISGANLTSLPAANITGTLPAISGANLTSLPAQATIANNADNRVITGGSGVNLNGEANLTFNGTKLDIDSSAQNILQLNSTHSDGPNIELQRSGSNLGYFGSDAANTGGTATDLALRAANNLIFASNGGNERVRITSAGFMGIGEDDPQTKLDVRGTISTGRNVARELGTIINISANYDGSRVGGNVINGNKNYEAGADWLVNFPANANLTIDLGAQYNCDRFVIYNQNEYQDSKREVKNFTLEGSNDNSSWTTVLDDNCGASGAHEPNPGFSFRMPASYYDDSEGVSYRYWKFTMKTFHGSDNYGGVMELELYEHSTTIHSTSEIITSSLVAGDTYAQTLQGIKRLYASQGMNIYTSGLSDTWEITETGQTTNGSYVDKSTIRHKRGVLAVSSSYNSGDLFIRVDNLYPLSGNAWYVFGMLILSNEIQGGQGGGHHYVTSLQLMGLGAWGSVSTQNIVGSMSVSVNQSGNNYVELFVNVNDSSRGPCTVICNGGVFDPPRISFH